MQNVDDRSLRTTQMAERDASSWSCLTEDEMWEILNEWVVALPREDIDVGNVLVCVFSAAV